MIDSNIRDRAYQFFIEEAPELLQRMESELLNLEQECNPTNLHELMRAAHSLKGGAATVGLDAIKSIAHRLEDIFKALYSDDVEVDSELESLLLKAYDCLKEPLQEQIRDGSFDSAAALDAAEVVFTPIEERLGDALKKANSYIPSSGDLGVDIISSIFEVDVSQGIERLTKVLNNPQEYELAGELRAQAEVFAGFAEIFDLPGFGKISHTAIAAVDTNPTKALQIIELVLQDWQQAREKVLAGDRTEGGSPSALLLELAQTPNLAEESVPVVEHDFSEFLVEEVEAIGEVQEDYPVAGESIFDSETLSLEDLLFADSTVAEETNFDSISLEELAFESRAEEIAEEVEADSTVAEETNFDSISLEELAFESRAEEIAEEVEADSTFLEESIGESSVVAEAVIEPQEESQLELPISDFTEISSELLEGEVILGEVENGADRYLPEWQEKLATPDNYLIAQKGALVPLHSSLSLLDENINTNGQSQGQQKKNNPQIPKESTNSLKVRVDLSRLEKMNNFVGELVINRNSLGLQQEQLQTALSKMRQRLEKFQYLTSQFQNFSDKSILSANSPPQTPQPSIISRDSQRTSISDSVAFDSLEMDSYSEIHFLLQETLEEMMQLEEAVEDMVLVNRQSERTIKQQQQTLTKLRDELMWARMLPVGELLNRFPRGLRELSIKYQKPVNLKMNGMEVLVDKGIWEKLYEPLLHLVRNAFAHGIEPPEIRKEQGKPEEGKIEIRAFHRGNQTIIEVSDDGRGLDLEKIVKKAIAKGWLSLQQLATTNKDKLLDFIFEPGFSTASQVNELCGRGVGLDVVRAQIEQLKGKVKVTSVPKQGTTFTLYLPLTLTISKFVVASVESTVVALPSESIKEIFFSKTEHIKTLGTQKFVSWREQLLSIHRLADLLDYYYPIPAQPKTRAFAHSKDTKTIPLLIIRGDQQDFALEIEGFDSEKELVIKPFHESIALPDYIYGCTVLGDGTFSPAIDPVTLLAYAAEQSNKPLNNYTRASLAGSTKTYPGQNSTVSTVLVVDDSVMMRRTLTHTLEKEGYRVLPARDGSEAMELLRQTPQINLIVSDLEMPNINGFEFLGQLRKDSELASIPVVLLTSRSNDKHRQLAIHLGAKAYLTKPYIEQEFLAALKEIMVNSLPAA